MNAEPIKHSDEVVLKTDSHVEPLAAAAPAAPFRFRKILVPIDFSDCSKKALQYALPLAKQHDAALTLLNVVPIPPWAVGEASGGENVPTLQRASGEQELARLMMEVTHGNVTADTAVRVGSPAIEIVALAKSLPADIIIISTHGHSGWGHVFKGSVSESVIRHSPCPVLVVRECEHEFLARSGQKA